MATKREQPDEAFHDLPLDVTHVRSDPEDRVDWEQTVPRLIPPEKWKRFEESIAETLRMIRTLGGMIGCESKTQRLVEQLTAGLEAVRQRAGCLPRRPRVYFEEWDEPQISCIRWVSELIAAAGGDDVFPELGVQSLGRNRIIADPLEVPRRAPDIILGSWCGKKFQPAHVAARPGWADVPAIRGGFVREIKSPIILQPGPAALTDGVRAIQEIIVEWAAGACRN